MNVRKTGLRWLLREHTAQTHHALDAKVSQLDMASVQGLCAFLRGNALAHRALLPFDNHFAGHMSRRDHLLRLDMEVLGMTTTIDSLSAQTIRAEAAPGYRYVIAGSAMGGRILAKRHAGSPDARVRGAGRFLNDPGLSEFWRDVQAELATFPETGPETDAVLAGAEACFLLFDRAFEAAIRAMPEAVDG